MKNRNKNKVISTFGIVVCHNEGKIISNCLNSLLTQLPPENIIVIDNNSSDNSVPVIKKHFPGIILLENSTNVGFGRANNQGIKLALQRRGDYFFLLNPDAWLETGSLQEMIKKMEMHPEYGLISPVHLNGSGKALDLKFFNYLKWYSEVSPADIDDLNCINNYRELFPISFVNAAAWLLSRKAVENAGGFDPLFFSLGDDDDLARRILFKEFKIGIFSTAKICHDRQDREEETLQKQYRRMQGMLLFKLKDPETKFPGNLWKVYKKHIKQTISAFRHGDMTRAWLMIKTGVQVFRVLPKVKKHRALSNLRVRPFLE